MSERKEEIHIRELPQLTFPNFAPKYMGREVLDMLKVVAEKLDEYELLILNGEMSVAEVAEYLTMTGLLSSCSDMVKGIKTVFKQNHDKISNELIHKDNRNEQTAAKRMRQAHRECIIDNVRMRCRPILYHLFNDLIGRVILDDAVAYVKTTYSQEKKPAQVLYEDLVKGLESTEIKDKSIQVNNMALLVLVELMKNQPTQIPNGSDHAIKFELLKERALENGEYPIDLPDNPLFKSAKLIFSEANHPMCWGTLVLALQNTGYNKILCYVDINYSGNELCVTPSCMITLREALELYGASPSQFNYIESMLIESVYSAVENGAINLREDNETDELELALEEAPDVLDTTDEDNNILFGENEEAKKTYNSESQVTDQNNAPLTKIVEMGSMGIEEQSSESRGNIRNISYKKARNALRRLGVRIARGRGKHPKLSYEKDGKTRTAVFLNSHSGKTRDIAHCVKFALKILGISIDEFVSALK